MWSIGQPTPNFTLEGHEKGVNCVDYYNGGKSSFRTRVTARPCVSILSASLSYMKILEALTSSVLELTSLHIIHIIMLAP